MEVNGPTGEDAVMASARWWGARPAEYIAEHGDFLGDADLRWCPEGLTEDSCAFLGPVAGARVLEVGAGAGQGARWVARHGGDVVASDVAEGMLRQARIIAERTAISVPLICADARALPFADDSFDIVFTAFGVLPFVPDPGRVHREVARVLRAGGRWVFSTTHPMRWVFADDPDPDHLRVVRPYFDAPPYVEHQDGVVSYAEFQHTMADVVGAVIGAGFVLDDLLEPRWVPGNSHTWGAWSAARAPFVPGTLIIRAHLP